MKNTTKLAALSILTLAFNVPVFANSTASANAPAPAAPQAAADKAEKNDKPTQTTQTPAPQAAKPNTNNNIKQNDTVVLQAGTFSNPELAYKQAARVSLSGVPAKVVKVQGKNGSTVRVVRSSQTFKASDAEKIATDLRKDNINVMLLKQ